MCPTESAHRKPKSGRMYGHGSGFSTRRRVPNGCWRAQRASWDSLVESVYIELELELIVLVLVPEITSTQSRAASAYCPPTVRQSGARSPPTPRYKDTTTLGTLSLGVGSTLGTDTSTLSLARSADAQSPPPPPPPRRPRRRRAPPPTHSNHSPRPRARPPGGPPRRRRRHRRCPEWGGCPSAGNLLSSSFQLNVRICGVSSGIT